MIISTYFLFVNLYQSYDLSPSFSLSLSLSSLSLSLSLSLLHSERKQVDFYEEQLSKNKLS